MWDLCEILPFFLSEFAMVIGGEEEMIMMVAYGILSELGFLGVCCLLGLNWEIHIVHTVYFSFF